MNANLSALLYLVAGVLFILSLRGLSSPASSRRGNFLGMAGMVIAIGTTLANHPPADGIAWLLVILGVAIGGGIGAVIARRVPMTSMPELVAAFHSLVGMAAVLVAAGAFYAPEAFDIGTTGHIHTQSLVEMSLGVAIGALTFTGSVIAFLKLSARMSGAPILLPLRHVINLAMFAAIVLIISWFVRSERIASSNSRDICNGHHSAPAARISSMDAGPLDSGALTVSVAVRCCASNSTSTYL